MIEIDVWRLLRSNGAWSHLLALCVLVAGPAACTDDDAPPRDGSDTGTGGTTSSTGPTGSTSSESSGADGESSSGAEPSEHEQICMLIESGIGLHDGFAIPGEAGAPRWGVPDAPPVTLRVRRSWSTLDDAEKQTVVDAFLTLKSITVDSGDPGSPRADYSSFCEALGQPTYERNLYDFYVEAHANAFVSMMTPHQVHEQMAHKAPQFLVWHRYLLLRLEADMGEAIGDPDFALPYWDWNDCYEDGDPTTCTPLFEPEYLGTAGGCQDGDKAVSGYMADQGFATNLHSQGMMPNSPGSIVCGQRPIEREVGCNVPGPPSTEEVDGIFDRFVYDDAPYDGCHTEEDVSFRQHLEGFDNESTDPFCVAAGCGMHGRAHAFVGGDMLFTSTNPNDPTFFLHHAQVDRLWAAWQEANLQSGDAARMVDYGNPGYPEGFRGPLFNFEEVDASETFDYRVLGYEYDALPSG
jgi:tyrosinase